MMRALRDKRTMHVILWMLVAVFVSSIFFVFGMKFTSSGKLDANVYAAKVGDDGITRVDFNKACQPVLERLYASQEGQASPEEIKKVQEQVLDTMVNEKILQQTAQKLGVEVSDEELAGVIQNQSYFKKDGKFDKATYIKVLQDHQLSLEEFETSQREELLSQKLRSILMDNILVTQDEVNHYAELFNRDLKAAYVSLDMDQYAKKVQPKEEDLKDYYEKIRSQFDHPERKKVRHIYLGSNNPGAQVLEGASKTLSDYRDQVNSGKASFSDLAKKYSQDPSTKDKGGEFGWVERGTFKDAQDLEDTIFSLQKGAISKPFKLGTGYDIVQVEDTEKAYKSNFEEVRSKVLKQYQREQAGQKVYSLSTQLMEKLKDGGSLEKAAKDMALTASSTDWFNGGSDIKGLKGSKEAAHELAGSYLQDWKGPISLGQKEYFFQITDARDKKNPASSAGIDKAALQQELMNQRQQSWLKDFLEAQKKKLGVKSYLNS